MLILAGISHKTAPVEVRERLAFSSSEIHDLLPDLQRRFGPSVALSTCNRTEVYVSTEEHGAAVGRQIAAFLWNYRAAEVTLSSQYFSILENGSAVRHLFHVAAGVESMVLGEAQILGQVRGALVAAEKAGSADWLLKRLFQTAISAGRKARIASGIGEHSASVSSTAVNLARQILGDLSDTTVLVVSAGEASKLTVRSLIEAGAARILVCSRTVARAERLAYQLGGTALPMNRLDEGLALADIVVSATGAPEYLIDRSMVEPAMQNRRERRMLIVDLAVPRDVEPAVRAVDGVSLYDIDSLQPLAGEGDSPGTILQAVAVVDAEVNRFIAWLRNRQAVPTIAALRNQAEAIRQAEVAKTMARLPDLSAEQRERVEALSSAIVKRVLSQPIARLKEWRDDPRYVDTVRDLFAIEVHDD